MHIKRTIKKHPLLSTIIIDSNQFPSILILYFVIIAVFILIASQCCLSFFIMYARIHTHRRVFPYFFFRPCYTHFILIGRWGYHLLHRFVCHTQNRKVSFLYTNMIVFTIITVNFAFRMQI